MTNTSKNIPVAKFADQIFTSHKSVKNAIAKINAYAEQTGQAQKYNEAQIRVHLAYRNNQKGITKDYFKKIKLDLTAVYGEQLPDFLK